MSSGASGGDDEVRDTLPDDLDATRYVGPLTFPDNARRRYPAILYLVIGVPCIVARLVAGEDAVLVNDGFIVVGLGLIAFGLYGLAAAWPLRVDATDALVSATEAAGFPVGHASASLGWRGLRSRPTWRVLLFSHEDPPRQRGLVLVDGVEGGVLEHFVEDNPEQHAQPQEAP